jgi:adhesin/invasin
MSLVEAGVTLGGTLTQTTNTSGLATFGDLKITKAGTYHLVAAVGGVTVVSSPFNITPGSAISITAVSGGGQSAGAGSAYASPLIALVQDAFNNPIQNASVTFAAPQVDPRSFSTARLR